MDFWQEIGLMVGQPLGGAWATNYLERGKNKARDRLAALDDPTAADRGKAMRQMDARYGGDLIGKNPETLLLQQKRDWMQADNDAQYLLDNGYAEDSKEVQEFRKKQAAAHAFADDLRGLGKSKGIDLSETGAGLGLAELRDAVNRSIAPLLYQKYPDMQEQLAARHAWAGDVAKKILSEQITGGGQPSAAPVSSSVQGVGGAAASPAPAGGAAPMTPPAAQFGGYAPQGTSLIGFDPNAGFGRTGVPNPVEGTANPSLPGGTSNGYSITSGDIYKYLQDAGRLPKDKTYAEEVEEIAKAYAKQRAAQMDDREIRRYLKEQGVPSYIMHQVMAERKQQAQETAKKNALAQAAAASSSDQMAALIAWAAANPNVGAAEIANLINVTTPNMQMDTIDLGGTKVAMTRDAKGRVAGGAQVLPVTLSPNQIAQTQLGYDRLGYQAQNDAANRDAANYRARLSSNTALQSVEIRAGGGGGTGGGTRQYGGLKTNEALNIIKQAQEWDEAHPGEEWANPLADARDKALVSLNDYGDVNPDNEDSVYHFGQNVLEQNARDGFPYTVEELKQIIRSVGGDWAEQAAENLLSGEGRKYGRDG